MSSRSALGATPEADRAMPHQEATHIAEFSILQSFIVGSSRHRALQASRQFHTLEELLSSVS